MEGGLSWNEGGVYGYSEIKIELSASINHQSWIGDISAFEKRQCGIPYICRATQPSKIRLNNESVVICTPNDRLQFGFGFSNSADR